ncbi:hypothetical protein BC830DRAFT_1148393 [Chytriomyces sp. MP71]|nr:hypothetical protein BC830DRAFT_1148393 [Chytriomyces sp. MP71]
MRLFVSPKMPLKWGVLGTGFIANKVLNLGMRRAGHELVAVGSRSLQTAQAFAEKNGIAKAYGSYQAVLDDPDVQAVYIALPSMFHEEWVEAAAKANKHILCEKPVAPTLAQVQRMLALCEEHNVVFLDGTFFKHHPRTTEIRRVISSGALGNVTSVHSHFSFLMNPAATSASQIRINPATEPTGVLGDMAWYTVRFSLLAYAFELPHSVSCSIVRRHALSGAAEQVVGQLLFHGGRSALFEASFAQVSIQRSCVTGDKGALALNDTFLTSHVSPITKEAALAFEAPKSDGFEVSVERGKPWERREVDMEGKLNEEWMVLQFAECVAGQRSWKEWSHETLVIHTVLDKLWESAQNEGVPVYL